MKIIERIAIVIVFSSMTWFAFTSTAYAVGVGNSEHDLRKLLDAICEVESGCDPLAVGDGGKAIGPYQIWMSYWIDDCN